MSEGVPKIAVVIPAYREAGLIGRTVRGIPPWVHEILVVDDGSDDGTDRATLAVPDPRLRLLRFSKNRGVGAAIAAGYALARRQGADVIVVMAGDAQMDPVDLPHVLAPILEGRADYVKGNRLLHPCAGDMPLLRRLGTQVLGRWTSWATGLSLGDSQCGYTAIAGSLVDRLPLDRLYPRYGYPNDLLSWIALKGGRVVEVPVRPVYAGERSGLRPRHLLVIGSLLIRAAVRRRIAHVSSPAFGWREDRGERWNSTFQERDSPSRGGGGHGGEGLGAAGGDGDACQLVRPLI
ncbi:MAG: glycosyltransferase family 2 protein [Myxococcales bacterium]|nr:glycosyltransferase family 2 protein [Polyangiaceae bacterium]MDW8249212.1 glycosyltransferase family 2 protein [Myxococcales bacterium]